MKGEKYILAIAIDDYTEPLFRSLSNAKHDAKRLIGLLTSKYNFQSIEKPLFDKAATRKSIIEALNELMSSLTKDDSLIIYHAGHGIVHSVSKKGYWIPFDASPSVGDWILHAEVKEYIGGCNAQHILLIDDSCFSGAFLSQTRSIDGVFNHYNKLSSDKSRWILTSGRVEKVSDGGEGNGSPFANSLLKYLGENTSRYFSVSELATYVAKETGSISSQQPKWGVLDAVGHEGGEMVFELVEKVESKKQKTWEENLALFLEAKSNRDEWPYISKMNPETKSLGIWCQEQRGFKRKNKLSKDRVEKLLRAGFIFDPTVEKFHKGFVKFLSFMHKTGLNDVPSRLVDQYRSENAWHTLQQRLYAKAPCNPNDPKAYPKYRFDALMRAGIPIEMSSRTEGWNDFTKGIEKFYETHQRFLTIPSQTDKNKEIANLGHSLNDWMVRWKGGHLEEERIKFLEQYIDKDYKLNKEKRSFEKKIKHYLKFRSEFPNEIPPKGFSKKRSDIKVVLDWKAQVNHRLQHGTSPIHKWKIARLNEINFPWNKKVGIEKNRKILPGLFD